MAKLVGVVGKVIGQVFAVGDDGHRRLLVEGDRLFAGEQLETGSEGAVAVRLQNGAQLTLGRGSSLEMTTDLLANRPARLSENLRRQSWWPEVREALLPLAHDGLLELGEDRAAVTELGRAFLPRIGMAVDRYLRRAQAA